MSADPKSPRTGASERRYHVFMPLLLVFVGSVIWMAFQTTQLWIERNTLSQLYANQEHTLVTAAKMRRQLDALASGVAKLAQGGNPHAKLIVDGLRRKGITINPSAKNTSAAQ